MLSRQSSVVNMKSTLESSSIFDVEFSYGYRGSIVEGSYHQLLRPDEQSPLTGAAVALQSGQKFDRAAETVGRSPTTASTEPSASVCRATTGTCCVTTLSYQPTTSTRIADQHKLLVAEEPTTIGYDCASSSRNSVTASHNVVATGSRLISNNQV